MAHRIDAEHDQDAGQGAVVMLRPRPATPVPRVTQVAAQPLPPNPAREDSAQDRKPIWDKDNFGFWLTACVLISLAFSIVWRAIG